MTIQAVHRRVWDDRRGEVVELPEIYGYECLKAGHVVGEGESREEAIMAALEKSEWFAEPH